MTSEPLNQYTDICKDAIKGSFAKLGETFENLLLEILLLCTWGHVPRKGDVPRHLTEKSITRNLISHEW